MGMRVEDLQDPAARHHEKGAAREQNQTFVSNAQVAVYVSVAWQMLVFLLRAC
jgi:hypothetical protein